MIRSDNTSRAPAGNVRPGFEGPGSGSTTHSAGLTARRLSRIPITPFDGSERCIGLYRMC